MMSAEPCCYCWPIFGRENYIAFGQVVLQRVPERRYGNNPYYNAIGAKRADAVRGLEKQIVHKPDSKQGARLDS